MWSRCLSVWNIVGRSARQWAPTSTPRSPHFHTNFAAVPGQNVKVFQEMGRFHGIVTAISHAFDACMTKSCPAKKIKGRRVA